jgi:hypothetical protein
MAQHKGKIDLETAKLMEADGFDAFDKRSGPNERSLCGCVDFSPRGVPEWDWGKYYPGGTVQSKATDSNLARSMQLWAAMGHQCAPDFKAADFLRQHPEYDWFKSILKDMKTQPWTLFTSGMKQ